MIYVTSDLHGCSLETLLLLLEKVRFSEDDFLYILGDVIDRGEHGAQLLLWITQQSNVQLILGNHEAQMLACSFVFEEVSDRSLEALSAAKMHVLENWMQNGGLHTLNGFRSLLKKDPESVEGILDYLLDCPLYECISMNQQRFVLVHGGLENFHPERKLEDYEPEELLMARLGIHTTYYEGVPKTMVVFGHTPTVCFGQQYNGRALKTDTWICIDTGVAYGNAPMLLRLDDMEEFYLGTGDS